jgi:hypothetical protein
LPYGDVETLVTLQAENLGEIVESPVEDKTTEATTTLGTRLREVGQIIASDQRPTTMAVLKSLSGAITQTPGLVLYASNPRKVENAVPELRGRVVAPKAPLQMISRKKEVEFAAPGELTDRSVRVVLGTAQADPLFGLVDSAVSFCLEWVTNARWAGYEASGSKEPSPFKKTDAYDAVAELSQKFQSTTFVTIVPRGGKPHQLLEDAPFDAVKNAFESKTAPQSRAMIVGTGGRGYDDTLSGALRLVWGSLNCVRPSGEILLLAECADGLGSRALEMLVTGRMTDDGRKKSQYVEGIEELAYLRRLKEDYGVILLSGLPEFYSKSKLGLTIARGSGEGVGKLLGRLARTTKVNVVIRAAECLLSSA